MGLPFVVRKKHAKLGMWLKFTLVGQIPDILRQKSHRRVA
jgi:hypothetical protein